MSRFVTFLSSFSLGACSEVPLLKGVGRHWDNALVLTKATKATQYTCILTTVPTDGVTGTWYLKCGYFSRSAGWTSLGKYNIGHNSNPFLCPHCCVNAFWKQSFCMLMSSKPLIVQGTHQAIHDLILWDAGTGWTNQLMVLETTLQNTGLKTIPPPPFNSRCSSICSVVWCCVSITDQNVSNVLCQLAGR